MRIGEVAAAAGCSIQTLRYYERRGLLQAPERTAAGYRQYPPDTVRLIRFIKRAQDLGFTLDEIEELLKLRDATGKRRGEIRSVAKAKMRDRKQSRSAAGNASRSGWLGRRMRQAPGGRKLSHPRGIERSG
jgi:DNA-binding transcriptional MerR regulator